MNRQATDYAAEFAQAGIAVVDEPVHDFDRLAVSATGSHTFQIRNDGDETLKLAKGKSAQIPLHQGVQIDLRVETPRTIHPMEVNFEQAAARWKEVSDYLEKNFTVVKK